MQNDILEKIGSSYYRLTNAEKKVADFVLSHPDQTQYMSISELAESCSVADATVSRFCRRLHFSGYSSFKIAVATAQRGNTLRQTVGRLNEVSRVEDVIHRVYMTHSDTVAQSELLLEPGAVSQAVEILRNSKRVLCMGQGDSMFIAMEAAHLFSIVSPKFYAVEDSHRQAMVTATLSQDDAILLFSYSGATKDLMDTMEIAKEHGAKRILVTHFPKSPGAEYADVVLQSAANESPLQLGSVAAKIAQLYIADVLYQEYCRCEPEQTEANMARVVNALAKKHL